MTPPPIPNERQNTPAMTRHFTFAPLPPDQSPALLIEALLKHPGQIIHELQFNWRIGLTTWLVVFAVAGMALYGLVVGSFSGGAVSLKITTLRFLKSTPPKQSTSFDARREE